MTSKASVASHNSFISLYPKLIYEFGIRNWANLFKTFHSLFNCYLSHKVWAPGARCVYEKSIHSRQLSSGIYILHFSHSFSIVNRDWRNFFISHQMNTQFIFLPFQNCTKTVEMLNEATRFIWLLDRLCIVEVFEEFFFSTLSFILWRKSNLYYRGTTVIHTTTQATVGKVKQLNMNKSRSISA